MGRLTEIGNKYNTDKGTVAYEKHGYTEEYSKYIPEKGFYHLLEIGVWHGDSIKMWTEYNPDMYVVGVDIDPDVINWIPLSGFTYGIHILDATNEKSINHILDQEALNNDIDFIIDDGSHRYEDILASFKLLYPKLKPGGYYFIEDLHAGQAQRERLLEDVQQYLKENSSEKGYFTWNLCNNKLFVINKL